MSIRNLLAFAATLALTGCITGYSLVEPGVATAGDLRVTAGTGWNRAPAMVTPEARKDAQTWTRDGIYLDRLVLIPAVADGETLIVDKSKSAALPRFRKDMLPNEIEELLESTLVKYFGEGNATVTTANLRPQKFGDYRGLMFEIEAKVTDSPSYRGQIGAFVADDTLYSLWYIAAEPYYHEKHQAVAKAVIGSATLAR